MNLKIQNNMEENYTHKFDNILKQAANNMPNIAPADAWVDIYNTLHPKKKKHILGWWFSGAVLLLCTSGMGYYLLTKNINTPITVKANTKNNELIINTTLNKSVVETSKTIENKSTLNTNPIKIINNNSEKNYISEPSKILQAKKTATLANQNKPIKSNYSGVQNKFNANKNINNNSNTKTNLALYKNINVATKPNQTKDDIIETDGVLYNGNKIEKQATEILNNAHIITINVIPKANAAKPNLIVNNNVAQVKPKGIVYTLPKTVPLLIKPNNKAFKKINFSANINIGTTTIYNQNRLLSNLNKRIDNAGSSGLFASVPLSRAAISNTENKTRLHGQNFGIGITANFKTFKRFVPYIGLNIAINSWQNRAYLSTIALANATTNNLFISDAINNANSGNANYSSVLKTPLANNTININNKIVFLNIPVGFKYLINKNKKLLLSGDKFYININIAPSIILKEAIFYHDNATERYFKLSSLGRKINIQTSFGLQYNFGNSSRFGLSLTSTNFLYNINKQISQVRPLALANKQLGLHIRF